jgi:hypothetical protein
LPPEKRRPPDEFFDLKTMRKTALAVYVVAKDSTLTLLREQPPVPPEVDVSTLTEVDMPEGEIIKYVLARG